MQLSTSYSVSNAGSIAVGDFNGDGRVDLVVGTGDGGTDTLRVFLGNGDGTFQPPVSYPVPVGSPTSIAVGDFNGDGKLDLAAGGDLLLGNGDGTFRTAVSPGLPGGELLAAGDVNGDGKLDVVGDSPHQVSLVLGNGNGTFQFPMFYGSNVSPPSLALGDFNGDGRLDIATSGYVLLGIQVVPASISIDSGNNQTGPIETTLTLAVKVVGTDGNPFEGATVTFAVVSGSAGVIPTTATSASNGIATTRVTFGGQPGVILVTASVAGLPPVTFTMTAVAPTPQISPGGVVSAGLSYPPIQAASPDAILSIFGQNFAPVGTNRRVSPSDLVNGLLPTNLGGACVLFGNQRAPMFFVAPTQLNVQAPQLPSPPSTVAVQVIANCDLPNQSLSNTLTVSTQVAAPEFFYVGLTTPAFASGQLPTGAAQVTGLTVSIDGSAIDPSAVQYAGVVPDNAGLYQLNLALPLGLIPGDHTIVMNIDGASSPSLAYISVGATQ